MQLTKREEGHDPCPTCGSHDTGVYISRIVAGRRWRRRTCLTCFHKWTTYEVHSVEMTILKKVLKAPRDVQNWLRRTNG